MEMMELVISVLVEQVVVQVDMEIVDMENMHSHV